MTLTEEQILEVRDSSTCVADMLQKLGLNTYWALKYHCNKFGISLQVFKQKYHIDYDEFMKLYNQGLSDSKIGEILQVNPKRIQDWRAKRGLPKAHHRKVELTSDQYQIFIGGMYGDSCLVTKKDSNESPNLVWAHSLKQKNYCLWKYEQLKDYMLRPYETFQQDKRTGKVYPQIRIVSQALLFFRDWYDKFYHTVDGKHIKYINEEIFRTIEPLGLAIWFQDDGFKYQTGYGLSTNCYSQEDIEIIQRVLLEKFDIHTNYHKSSNILYIPTKDREKFKDLVSPYINEDCLYKLGVVTKPR